MTVYLKSVLILFIFLLITGRPAIAQDHTGHRLVFYNLENLFDTEDDSLTRDEEFTPGGVKHWTPNRYRHKLLNIYKMIAAMSGNGMPALMGFAELENERVLKDLIGTTPLKKAAYDYIHYDSRDIRGIDVALVYMPERFMPLASMKLEIEMPWEDYITRDILYVKGLFKGMDEPVHVFVNHWPSRRSGVARSEELRLAASRQLKEVVDTILANEPGARFIIMGDFNDQPFDRSLSEFVVEEPSGKAGSTFNMAEGSYKYRGQWYRFDNIFVNEMHNHVCKVFNPDFLLIEDKTWMGRKPFPTYSGYKYLGGFSDHLPVYLDLIPVR